MYSLHQHHAQQQQQQQQQLMHQHHVHQQMLQQQQQQQQHYQQQQQQQYGGLAGLDTEQLAMHDDDGMDGLQLGARRSVDGFGFDEGGHMEEDLHDPFAHHMLMMAQHHNQQQQQQQLQSAMHAMHAHSMSGAAWPPAPEYMAFHPHLSHVHMAQVRAADAVPFLQLCIAADAG